MCIRDRQYGMKQIYAENGGPGGLFHSLRIIPPILEICEDINNICPEAYVYNFSNPMQRICHAVTVKYPNMKFIGLCHAIAEMERDLPELLNTDFSNIEYRAGGLNHISILTDVKYKDTKKDAYPLIRKKALEYYKNYIIDFEKMNEQSTSPGAERGIFLKLFETYNYLPITTDSHLGEYLQWAYSVADHEGIMDFYDNYKKRCLSFYDDENSYSKFFDTKESKNQERIVPIIEAILNDANIEESAVNVPNNNFIPQVPNGIVVEVPGILNKNGVTGIKLNNYPSSFGTLLNNQSGTIQLTTDAVLNKSKHSAYLAMLADPVVDNARSAEKLLDTIIEFQNEYLGYLK